MDQISALQQIFENSWEYAKEVHACFVDHEKAYDRIPRDKLWVLLLQHGLMASHKLLLEPVICGTNLNIATQSKFISKLFV